MAEKTITVTLGERETDVLVYLTERGGSVGVTRDGIAAAMGGRPSTLTPHDIMVNVTRALNTLHALRFVGTTGGGEVPLRWYATADGVDAVRAASTGGRS